MLSSPTHSSLRSGFTVLEMVVAIGVFSIVIGIAMGGFINATRTQRQVTSLLAVNSNVSLVLEQIAREVRTGYDFCVDTQASLCVGPRTPILAFVNAKGARVTYCLSGGAIVRGEGGLACGAGGFEELTGTNVTVRNLEFILRGEQPGVTTADRNQPRVTIVAEVSGNDPGISSTITPIQTTVSSRAPLDAP